MQYGNIDDMLVHVKMVTPIGTVERNSHVPRISSGPDVQQMVLGSEGIYGVITEATMKVRALPECREYGSIAFPDFESGVALYVVHCAMDLRWCSCKVHVRGC